MVERSVKRVWCRWAREFFTGLGRPINFMRLFASFQRYVIIVHKYACKTVTMFKNERSALPRRLSSYIRKDYC